MEPNQVRLLPDIWVPASSEIITDKHKYQDISF